MTFHPAFELLTDQPIRELNSRARLYRHLKTGAELLSLENGEENKVFGITFRTPPPDSTGLPHIMEHAVLCGSRKYPVREPFVELLKGSMATFVNAMTFPDKTTYPVASQNLQDFYNLIDVYLDAVFYPLIPIHTLQQEGWHYELNSLDSPLIYKGVVLNEMKGAYSSPDNLLSKYSLESLFPDHPYGQDSGGDPRQMPNLTYTQFKAFHQTYYHPSNVRIFYYGDDDPHERLCRIDETLKDFEPIQVASTVPLQPLFTSSQRQEFSYDAGQEMTDGGRKGMVTVNWMLSETNDPETALALGMLAQILIGTPASPLRKALIDSGLGEDLAGDGLETGLRQAVFSAGLKGISVQDADKVEAKILDSLADLERQGIETDTVAAAVNTMEFRLRENNTGQFPRGLSLMLRALSVWLYGGDPISHLSFEAPLATIKARLANGERYFENLIRLYFIANPHRTAVILKPQTGLAEQENAWEVERLTQARSRMSPDELLRIIESTQELKRRQETLDTPAALATIPTLALEDLERKTRLIPLAVLEQEATQVLYHDLFTNGILYLDIGFNLHTLPQELIPYVPLFGRALVEMGTQTEDFVKISQRIGRYTGGIFPSTLISAIKGKEEAAAWLLLRSKATLLHCGDLLAILNDLLHTVCLNDQARFRQMVLEEKAGQEAQVVPMGHRLVNNRLRSQFDQAGWATEQTGGISYLFFLRQLAEAVEKDWPVVLEKLERMRHLLFNRQEMLCNVTLDKENWGQVQPHLGQFLAHLPSTPVGLSIWSPPPRPVNEGLTIPAQVNYVGKGADLYSLGFNNHGSILVITNYLRTTWLWERVRVQGGAYGGFCMFDPRSGVFTYLSYRDPNLQATLDNYDGTGRFLQTLDLSPSELTRTIIGTIGDLDAYLLPDAKGYTSLVRYLTGETDEDRQLRRDEVLATTKVDFRALVEVMEQVRESGSVVVLGSAQAVEAANHDKPGWLEVLRVL